MELVSLRFFLKIGAFVVKKLDMGNESYPIWRIDKGSLLGYESVPTSRGQRFYKRSPAVVKHSRIINIIKRPFFKYVVIFSNSLSRGHQQLSPSASHSSMKASMEKRRTALSAYGLLSRPK